MYIYIIYRLDIGLRVSQMGTLLKVPILRKLSPGVQAMTKSKR